MAIVKAPALSMQASGNLGGICYTTYRGIQIAKGAWTGTVPNTPDQLVLQAFMTQVSQAWGQTLTVVQRESWNTLAAGLIWKARLGGDFVPTGYLVFMKLNMRRLIMNKILLTVAPNTQEWVEVLRFGGSAIPGPSRIVMRLQKAVGVDVDSYGVDYYKAGPYDSGGRKPTLGEWRFLILKTPPGLVTDLAVVVGKWYWYRARAVALEGTVQNWFEFQKQAV